MRALRQDYKEFTEGKDGSTMSALQEKFELLNGKKKKSDRFVTKKEVGTTEQSQYFPNFMMDFKQLRFIRVFRSVKVPLVKSSNVVGEGNKSSKEDKAGPAREKKGKISIGANNIMHLMES